MHFNTRHYDTLQVFYPDACNERRRSNDTNVSDDEDDEADADTLLCMSSAVH